MSKKDLRKISNNFQDVRLLSLASWRQAAEISPRDRNGPYVVLQEGYDPEDLTMSAAEFVLGRSGKWLSLGHFFQMPLADRRAEFVFGTAAEVMLMMRDLPSDAVYLRPENKSAQPAVAPGGDEMAAAMEAARKTGPGAAH